MTQNKIDFVITWVDGNDPEWQKKKREAKGIYEGDSRDTRYRDWETLRFWFRGIETFAPWVNKVFFVTCGHYPEWLNLECEKLKLVLHEDFIPAQYLPTFSCRPIEFNLHRIPGLSEQFVYFNDDMFLTSPVKPEDFFKNGLPCDSAILDAQSPTAKGCNGEKMELKEVYSSLFFNTAIINRNFSKKEVINRNRNKWITPVYGSKVIKTLLLSPWKLFTGFSSDHLPYSYLKNTYDKVWNTEGEVLHSACIHKFREPNDVSSRLLSYWQIVEGNFSPRSPKIGLQTFISNDDKANQKVFKLIADGKYKMICVNDEYSGNEFEKIKMQWIKSFELLLPDKSGYEI